MKKENLLLDLENNYTHLLFYLIVFLFSDVNKNLGIYFGAQD